jgi:predicted ArsR family transcriptional regulator
LLNCPFHDLAEEHRALVCSMNLELVSGLVSGLGAVDAVQVRLAPEPGYCCVRLSAAWGAA